MDERARIPVTLPVPNPTPSYWHSPPSRLSTYNSSPSPPSETDTLIIGSGITGAATAQFLLSSEDGSASPPDITMLEARTLTSGATGRNGGHTKAASYRSFLHHAETLGTEAACLIARLELANIRAVHAFAASHLKDKETESRPCIGYEAGSISGYRFTTGVLELCVDKGMKLFTETPALSVKKIEQGVSTDNHRWIVETPKGQIKARRVILATNGYTAFLHPRFQEAIVPMRGQITAHRPGSNMPKAGLATTYSFIYEAGYEYMIPKPAGTQFAGDIVIGGGLVRAPDQGLGEYGTTDDSRLNPVISAYLRETTPRYFGDDWGDDDPEGEGGGRVRAEWTGIMGFSPDGFPFVGEVPGEDGLWVCASFQGHGMVFCWMCARALAVMLEGRDGSTEEEEKNGEESQAEEAEEAEKQLGSWFPDAFRITSARLSQRFGGRVNHSTAGSADRT
ncbi:FAD dependent oxidoreductase [Colletotrichum simmondsii]|uniref:FAD dependent oxidoreductase n=1 Tax=Colletotrichum simmondsii TaxID=703756 RepID=A0A135TF44_9PEZI|nr:FAD dependent oxidoreductase [Colletotrichum simmondsii]